MDPLSPRDLIAELECNHRLNLEWSATTELIAKPIEELDTALRLVVDNGIAHEQRLVDKHKKLGTPPVTQKTLRERGN